jgi:putative hydrolase of the HAD superfamily
MRKVLFWDFHGTLAHNDWMFSKALYKVLKDYEPNTSLRIEDFKKSELIGFPWQEPEKEYLHLMPGSKWWKHVEGIFINFYKEHGLIEEDAANLASKVRIDLIKPDEFTLYDDTIEMLDFYKQRGFTNIILSNHIPELGDIASELGLMKYIDHCISSANVGYEKPNPKIYRYALDKLNSPKEVWMIGDSFIADVKGAEAAGINGVLVRSKKVDSVQYYSEDLRGLKSIIYEII